MNLPRWDKYNNKNQSIINKNKYGLKSNSIFIMFTWRDIKINKKICFLYIKNIIKLLSNNLLTRQLKKIILFYILHFIDIYIILINIFLILI